MPRPRCSANCPKMCRLIFGPGWVASIATVTVSGAAAPARAAHNMTPAISASFRMARPSVPEQQRCEFPQAAPPRQELVRSIGRHVEDAVDARLLQFLGRHLRIAGAHRARTAQFATAVADEYQPYLVLEAWRNLHVIRRDRAATEQADVREGVQLLQ